MTTHAHLNRRQFLERTAAMGTAGCIGIGLHEGNTTMAANLEPSLQTMVASTFAAAPDRRVFANPYRAGRTMTMSRRGIVATSQSLASQAGLDMLRSGGTAMDAAIAAAAVLNVVEPMSTGIGGDAFFIYYEAKTGKIFGLNGSGRSPMGLSRDHFKKKNIRSIKADSWESVTVPGAVDAWLTGLDRFGRKKVSEVLAPAIDYADNGFAVTPIIAGYWRGAQQALRKNEWSAKTFLADNKAPKAAEVFRIPNLAKTFKQIAEGGRDAFYKGPIAKEITRYAKETGGFLTMDDFAAHQSTWVEPITTNYRDFDVYQIPPNGQGIGVLLMLNLFEGFDLAALPHNSAAYLHLQIEAKKLAYADLYHYVSDPAFNKLPIKELLSKDYADKRRKLINPKQAAKAVEHGVPGGKDTIYLTAIDKDGNACSFINSIYYGFGSKITGGNTGVMLQNRGAGFVLNQGHFNEYAPGKRPYHTIIPGMVMKNGKLYMSYGLMGGPMQPQGHAQFLASHIDHGLDIQEANDVPRWRHLAGSQILLEHGIDPKVFDALKKMGHEPRWADGVSFGGAQAVMLHPKTGTFLGSSDPRKDGAALGY